MVPFQAFRQIGVGFLVLMLLQMKLSNAMPYNLSQLYGHLVVDYEPRFPSNISQ